MFDAVQRKGPPIGRAALLLVLGVGVIGFIRCGVPWSGRDIAPQVTAAKVRQVELGSDEATVINLLGEPFVKEQLSGGRVGWRYTRPVERVERFPTLTVTFQDGRVVRVFSEMSVLWGTDEDFLYLKSDGGNGEAVEFAEVFNTKG